LIPSTLDFFIKDYPAAVAVLDNELKFVNYSKIWHKEFNCQSHNLFGKKLEDVFNQVPKVLKNNLLKGFEGASVTSTATKISAKGNNTKWLKWKISPLKLNSTQIDGVLLQLEDVSEYERNKELFLQGELVSNTGSWELNLLENTLYWSPMTKIIHELPQSYIPNLEEGINFYKEGEHRENITQLVSNAIAKGTNWDTELIIVTAKGNEKWVRAKGEVERINGKNVRIVGAFQDIDEKKKAELLYRETSERLKIATSAAKIGIWEFDIEANSLVWDDNMYSIYGIEKKNFTQVFEAWEAVVYEEDKEQAKSELAMAIAGEKQFNTQFRIVWPNGTIRNIKAIAHVEKDTIGRAVKVIGANWDITQVIHTQSKLFKTEKSLTAAFEYSNIGMAYLDLDYNFTKINNSLSKTLGYLEKELINLNFTAISHEDDIHKTEILFKNLIKGKKESFQLEKRYYHKNGRIINTIKTVTAVKNIDGEISHFICQIIDITPRISAEKKLRSLISVTKEQNESLTNFAHIVSHNLRSHSTNMSMLTNFLNQEKDEEERKNIATMLVNAAESLDETILHLNDVVQVKTGALEKMQRVNVLSSIKTIEKSIEAILQEKKAVSKIKVKDSDFVYAVPAYFESIFLNLYTNSLKYFSHERNLVIEISTSTKNETLIISFKDNGQGIDLERHGSKIFGMYKTFHKHKDAKGIGLFITKNQVESMGGTITVESEIDKGTTFNITLKQG
jgi:PAS domain S-box-containing protein